MSTNPIVTMTALINEYWIKAFKELDITMQTKPSMKYVKVESVLSSNTFTTYSAAATPPLALKNLPGPNTEQVAALRMAHSSKPIAPAVNARYRISNTIHVLSGKLIRNELKPNPANIAAIPLIEL